MSRFLFVHGVYHGPECWDGVVQRLRGRGHECHAVALRGHGPDEWVSARRQAGSTPVLVMGGEGLHPEGGRTSGCGGVS